MLEKSTTVAIGEINSSSSSQNTNTDLPVIQKSNLAISSSNEIGFKEDKKIKHKTPPKVPPKPSKEVLSSHVIIL